MQPFQKPTIVIESRGGTIVAVYGDRKVADVLLVDWDEAACQEAPGCALPVEPLTMMTSETGAAVGDALSHRRGILSSDSDAP